MPTECSDNASVSSAPVEPRYASVEPRYASVHDAVRAGDAPALELLHRRGATLSQPDPLHGMSPLHWAAHAGSLECMHWLLWHGADPEATAGRGWTALHVAALRGQHACAQALLASGADVSRPDARGCTAAHLSAGHGHSFTLLTLLRAGADASAPDARGWGPAHCAAFHGRLGCLQLLVRWGARLDDTDSAGNTAAHLAAAEGHVPCLRFTLGASPAGAPAVLGARNDHGETPEDAARRHHRAAAVEVARAARTRPPPGGPDEDLAFPAHVAAHAGDLESLRRLVESGVITVNERDGGGGTPLHKAAGQGHLDCLQWLLQAGANAHARNDAGETPRDTAKRFAQLAAVRLLAAGRIDSDSDSSEGEAGPAGTMDRSDAPTPSAEQRRAARRRAQARVAELERLLGIARSNAKQLGGVVQEEEQRRGEQRRLEREAQELRAQLEYERLRREELERLLDESRGQTEHLRRLVEELQGPPCGPPPEPVVGEGRARSVKNKNSKRRQEVEGRFVRRLPQ
ncbi:ankyrin repeat domain-containing protein 42 [Petromyzon marinus]|uniref:Ankyrin repeat domain-containing protein 42 n=1 Tax=Petromyzon marinus TaxID=7757 RepID=A0AAJ7U7B3_PETMA|nr:ankyrin repeat domain-containing protein 42 [Petromyzon marinus]